MVDTNISWADKVWNPVTGCTKVSAGCKNCYAERMSKRLAGRCGYPKDNPFAVTLHPEKLSEPLHWKKPSRIFVCSMGDLFHEAVPDKFIDKVFTAIALSPQHTFLVLTKRPERMVSIIPWFKARLAARDGSRWPIPNVMLGVSVEDQQTADERIPLLLQTPAAKRFVSYEPALGPVDFRRLNVAGATYNALLGEYRTKSDLYDGKVALDQIIMGGESGPGARPMHPDWARSVRDHCQAAGLSFFFKQWGEWVVVYDRDKDDPDWRRCPKAKNNSERYVNLVGGYGFHGDRIVFMRRVGKKATGCLLDGVEHKEVPA